MPRLEELSIKHRIALTIAIVIVVILLLALIGYLTGGWEADARHDGTVFQLAAEDSRPFVLTEARPSLQPAKLSKYEREFIDLDRNAVKEAYHNQILHLFQIWMRDETGQPARAIKGATQARSAFERTMDAINDRERKLQEQGAPR
jgi:hypothetical protein